MTAEGTGNPPEPTRGSAATDGPQPTHTQEPEPLREELILAHKMQAVGQLVGGIAHDLNNQLAAIVGFSQLLATDRRLPNDLTAMADTMVEQTEKTRRLITDLLDFIRRRPPERHPTSLRPLIQTVLDLQAYDLNAGRITVTVDVPADAPVVELDRSLMQQVLLNLTMAAVRGIRAGRDHGSLRVTAEGTPEGGGIVRIAIEDDGQSVVRDGAGIDVSRAIVESHGGRLLQDTAAEGDRWVIELPVGSTGQIPALPSIATAIAPESNGRPKVLVLDDEPSIRAFLAKALGIAGCDSVAAATGEEAVELARRDSFDAMLCDHRMAGMTGTTVFEAVTAIQPQLARRFVFMSGDVMNAELTSFARQHGITVLAKPFDLDAIGRTMREILQRG